MAGRSRYHLRSGAEIALAVGRSQHIWQTMEGKVEGIYRLDSGHPVEADIHRMYATHGPYMMGGRRLDKLSDVVTLVDSSTTASYETGTHTTRASTTSVLGRALVGGILTGGAGAIVGGVTAKRRTQIHSETTESRNIELTLRLDFVDGPPVNVVVTRLESYHWLLAQVEIRPATDAELSEQKALADAYPERRDHVDRMLAHEKPVSRERTINVAAAVAGVVGLILGYFYGTYDLSKLFFAALFGASLFAITYFVTGMAVYLTVGSDIIARMKYEKKWQETYDKLYPE